MLNVLEASAEASKVVDELGIVGTLGVVILLLVVANVWMIKNLKQDVNSAATYSKKVDRAVNGIGEGEHRLYDRIGHIAEDVKMLVDAQHAFDEKGWASLPIDLGSASNLTSTIRTLQHNDEYIRESLARIESRLVAHVEWEEKEKYGHTKTPN